MTAKLPGDDSLTASVITPPVPFLCCSVQGPSSGLPYPVPLASAFGLAVLPAFTARCRSWETQVSPRIFVKLFFSQKNSSTKDCGYSQVSGDSKYKGAVGKAVNFERIEGAVG